MYSQLQTEKIRFCSFIEEVNHLSSLPLLSLGCNVANQQVDRKGHESIPSRINLTPDLGSGNLASSMFVGLSFLENMLT